MNKTLKKTLSIILSILMIVTTVPFAFALDETVPEGKISLENAVLSLSQDTFYYDGKEHIPEVTVTLDGVTLTRDVDHNVYIVSCMKKENDASFFG